LSNGESLDANRHPLKIYLSKKINVFAIELGNRDKKMKRPSASKRLTESQCKKNQGFVKGFLASLHLNRNIKTYRRFVKGE